MKFTGTPREVGYQILAWAGPLRADSVTIEVTLDEDSEMPVKTRLTGDQHRDDEQIHPSRGFSEDEHPTR